MKNETTWYQKRTSAKANKLAKDLNIALLYSTVGELIPGDSIEEVAHFLKLEIPFMMRNFFYLSALPTP